MHAPVTREAPYNTVRDKRLMLLQSRLPLFAKDAFAYYPFIIVVCIAFGVSSFGVFAFLDYM